MKNAIVISARVADIINHLSPQDGGAITQALFDEFVFHQEEPWKALSPLQALLYVMIRQYVKNDITKSA